MYTQSVTNPQVRKYSQESVGLEGDLDEIDLIDADSATVDVVNSLYGPMLHTKDLRQIQQDIAGTVRPTWRTSPPKDFGSPSHGKPKADEWRACIEFDLPVSLVKLWLYNEGDTTIDASEKILRRKMIESTMYLATAIRWATSHRTSKNHAERFKYYIACYLRSLRELRPHMDLHPIHHNALHLPDFLLEFGPMHGWWMFAFERLIGILQKINTNFHFGKSRCPALTRGGNSLHHRSTGRDYDEYVLHRGRVKSVSSTPGLPSSPSDMHTYCGILLPRHEGRNIDA